MSQLDRRLIEPLQLIAQLTLKRAPYQTDYIPGLDLFELRRSVVADSVVPYLRQQVEQLSGGKWTVRQIDRSLLDGGLAGPGIVLCALCHPNTPEGIVTQPQTGVFAFAVAGAESGYIPQKLKR